MSSSYSPADWVCHIGTLMPCTEAVACVTWWSGAGRIQALSERPTGFLQCFDTDGSVIWPVKIVPKMTYNVLSGTLSLYTTTPHACVITAEDIWKWGSNWSDRPGARPRAVLGLVREGVTPPATGVRRYGNFVVSLCKMGHLRPKLHFVLIVNKAQFWPKLLSVVLQWFSEDTYNGKHIAATFCC